MRRSSWIIGWATPIDKFPYKREAEGDLRQKSGRLRHTEERAMRRQRQKWE